MAIDNIAVVGVGRMGKGIALAFAYAGYPVSLIDSENRPVPDSAALMAEAEEEITSELKFLETVDVISETQLDSIRRRIHLLGFDEAALALAAADFIFEAVSETVEIKESVYSWLNDCISNDAIVSSTTSTMSANELAAMLRGPERFVNAHWLNPAWLMPLVEISPADVTGKKVVDSLRALLEGIGKVAVECRPAPGFIISRIQAAALNEAARIVEEGVASAEDVDRAIMNGFGIRYATLGLLEFIDFGGGDILFHASNYLAENLDQQRFSVPQIVKDNMHNQRNGMRDGEGFYQWRDVDTSAYRAQKMTDIIRLLQHRKLMPRLEVMGND